MNPPWKDISDIIQLYAMRRENKDVLSNRKKEIPSKEHANADNSVVYLLQGPQVDGCWNCVHDGPMRLDGSCETLQAESCFNPYICAMRIMQGRSRYEMQPDSDLHAISAACITLLEHRPYRGWDMLLHLENKFKQVIISPVKDAWLRPRRCHCSIQ